MKPYELWPLAVSPASFPQLFSAHSAPPCRLPKAVEPTPALEPLLALSAQPGLALPRYPLDSPLTALLPLPSWALHIGWLTLSQPPITPWALCFFFVSFIVMVCCGLVHCCLSLLRVLMGRSSSWFSAVAPGPRTGWAPDGNLQKENGLASNFPL